MDTDLKGKSPTYSKRIILNYATAFTLYRNSVGRLFGVFPKDVYRQVELDIEAYCDGVKRRDLPLLTHARRHLVKMSSRFWQILSSQVIRMVFHNPRCVFMSELKELTVRVARDYICREKSPPWYSNARLRLIKFGNRGEFETMLNEELRHSWAVGQMWEHPPPNTWYSYEQKYRSDLASMPECNCRL